MAQTKIDKRFLPLPIQPSEAGVDGTYIVNQIDSELGGTEWKGKLSDEQVQDIVGAMISSGTQSNIIVTYDDSDGSIDFTATGGTGGGLDQEQVEDIINNTIVDSLGIQAVYNDVAGTLTLSLTGEEFTTAYRNKLEGIEDSATANSSDSELRDRSTHTGTQLSSTISDFDTAVGDTTTVQANTAKRSYPVSDQNKLSNIEDNSTADQTAEEIKDSLESLTGVDRLDSTAIKNLPNGVTNLTWDSNSGQGVVQSDTGDDAIIPTVTGGVTGKAGLMGRDDKDKLDAIETGATADQTGSDINSLLDVELGNTRWSEQEVPSGGTTGQVLKKNTNTDFDYSWQTDNVGAGSGGATQLTELTDVGSATPLDKNVLIADGTDFDARQLVADDISDFDTEVSNNPSVSANTLKRTYPVADENKLSNLTVTQPINLDTGIPKLASANTFSNTNTFENTVLLDKSLQLKPSTPAGGATYAEIYFDSNDNWGFESTVSSGIFGQMDFSSLSVSKNMVFTDTGITWNGDNLIQNAAEIDITDTGSYFTGTTVETAMQEIGLLGTNTVTLDGVQTITGIKTINRPAIGGVGDYKDIRFQTSNTTNDRSDTDYSGLYFKPTGVQFYREDDNGNNLLLNFDSLTAKRTVDFPDKDGTIAMLSDITTGSVTESGDNDFTGTNAFDQFINIYGDGASNDVGIAFTELKDIGGSFTVAVSADPVNNSISLNSSSSALTVTNGSVSLDGEELATETYVDNAVGGGLSADNQNRILNANLFSIVDVTADFTIDDDTHVEIASGADIGKKCIVSADNSVEVLATIESTSMLVGATTIFEIESDTATINIGAGSGQILIGQEIDATNTHARMTGDKRRAVLTRISSTVVRIDGDYVGYEPSLAGPTDYFTSLNAANLNNETDATTGTRNTTGGHSIESVAITPTTESGSFALKLTRTSASVGSVDMYVSAGTLELGTDYTIEVYTRNVGSDWIIQKSSSRWDSATNTPVDSGTWVKTTLTGTAASNDDGEIRFFNGTAAQNDYIEVGSIKINKTSDL